MNRLLIIDDEPIIVNGLHEYFCRLPDVEVVLAYSAPEAISHLDAIKIDVVLSDICMPGMDGMELLGHIEERWPKCKVILLTGYDEFDYAHQALRSPCIVDYILKTEGMNKIGSVVNRAFEAVKDEMLVYRQKEWLEREFPKVKGQLQRQLLVDVLRRTDKESFRGLQDEFNALKLPFQVNKPVVAVMIAVENWGKYESTHERHLMLFAIGNIADELLGARSNVKFVPFEQASLVGFVQSPEQSPAIEEGQAEMTAKFTHGTLESVQQACGELFGISLSVAVSGHAMPFASICREAQRLRLAILSGPAGGAERLTIVGATAEETEEGARFNRQSAQYALGQLKQNILEGNGNEWFRYFGKLNELFPPGGPEDPFDRMLILHTLMEKCFICLEELGLKNRAMSETELPRILELDRQAPWGQTVMLYQSLFEWMQNMRSDRLRLEESHLIGIIRDYIHHHLDSDLSLTRIAREVSLNPSYLSRWYKQTTGVGLSDYIQEVKIEKGKEMLQTTMYKVHEISEKLGFVDPHYFFRFFKKAVGCTPHEYRISSSK